MFALHREISLMITKIRARVIVSGLESQPKLQVSLNAERVNFARRRRQLPHTLLHLLVLHPVNRIQ